MPPHNSVLACQDVLWMQELMDKLHDVFQLLCKDQPVVKQLHSYTARKMKNAFSQA
jgi:hypothetical protein